MELFCLPNQSTTEIFRAHPWDFEPTPPKSALKDRDAWRDWSKKPTTRHLFFSTFEGINPHLRISENNPPHLLHGLVADYDAEISEAMAKDVSFDRSHKWTAISRTFSGGRRAIWMFEEPLLLHSVQLTKRFIERAAKELRLDALLPGLDRGAIIHPAKYYECGTSWKVGHDLIPKNAVLLWLLEASQKFDFGDQGTAVPIDEIAKEVERKFPGRWEGEFQLGARGVRFWDPDANNPTAAIVRETGMQCFTGPQSFVPWAEIVGPKFVRKFEENKLGGAVDDIWYDGQDYWMQNPSGQYVRHNLQSIGRHLRVKRGLNGDRGKKDTHSEVDKALVMIEDHQRIAGALPLVHQPEGIITRTGRRYLNISTAQVMQPASGAHKWAQGFPWLAEFLDTFFMCDEAKECFLAWLQRFYVSALNRDLAAGQAIFLAGDVSQGKSFLTTVILAELMGGAQDASGYLLGETTFNKELFEACLWTVDDSIPAADSKKHALYSAMIKKMVANRVFEYHAKFRDAQAIPWIGRPAITLNKDVESSRILPDMEMNTLDKISLFMVRTVKDRPFPPNPTKHVIKELPHFAAWLRDWKPPQHVFSGNPRYGVRAYHDPELLEMAKESSDSAHFVELLDLFRDQYFDLNKDATHWKGSATEMFVWMTSTGQGGDAMRELARTYSPRAIGRNLSKLMAQGAKLRLTRAPGGGGRLWTIFKHGELPGKNKARGEAPVRKKRAAAEAASKRIEAADDDTGDR